MLKLSQKPLSLGQAASVEKIQPKQLKSGKVEHKLKHILLMEKCWVTSDVQSSLLHLSETHRQSVQLALCAPYIGSVCSELQVLRVKMYTLLCIYRAAQLPAAQDSWL